MASFQPTKYGTQMGEAGKVEVPELKPEANVRILVGRLLLYIEEFMGRIKDRGVNMEAAEVGEFYWFIQQAYTHVRAEMTPMLKKKFAIPEIIFMHYDLTAMKMTEAVEKFKTMYAVCDEQEKRKNLEQLSDHAKSLKKDVTQGSRTKWATCLYGDQPWFAGVRDSSPQLIPCPEAWWSQNEPPKPLTEGKF